MRRMILALVLLALAPAVGPAQTHLNRWGEIPVPPHVEQGSLWLTAASKGFWENFPALPQAPEEPSWPAPVAPDPWGTLRQLQSGEKIRVVDANLHRVNAQFLGVSDDFLKFRANGKTVIVEREKVMMVSLQPPSRAKQILLGILAGAMIGAAAWANASYCEKHGCYDEATGYWHEGSGKGYSPRSGYIATGIGAGVLGIFAALAGKSDNVIYFHDPRPPLYEAPIETTLYPEEAGQPEGGNVFAPVHRQGLTELPIERKFLDLCSAYPFMQ